MHLFPAIDLLGGKAVRLKQGRYEDPTVYSDDPPAVARRFRAHTDRLHVVDLEGAKAGAPVQRETIRAVSAAHGGLLQIGGGVRTREALEGYLALGASRVVLGTAAVKDPALVRALATAHPGVIVIAVDAKDGFVATEGWTEVSSMSAVDVVLALDGAPIAAVLYTDVARDGMNAGPNVAATAALAARSPFPVIASGGVATLEQIRALTAIANVESAIVGRALYDGSLAIEDALAVSRGPSRSPT
ncbi:MAG: 1-(5-phosphoribosyl)-5-[(5-phosphoribosylamino)methylideneamino] imidazole-4-carboxamide isomerase [Labilithrix sp.]|nr:1-(5-phosphoribosyl)-5-[(5-phosphoribosylamino)methylideneamino] imidazole-4-carboxamide isomerase [Labilithrix sp.]MCW5813657.1 1-(5-phosphoribosyl)-5-[(5-phosphoribosylamino)methylideneamino] imidazole-4-carboxamide isomerase [Labilithrix sp.]